MSIHVKNRSLASGLALAGIVSCVSLLAGCSFSRFVGDPMVVNSVNTATNADLNQSFPIPVSAVDVPSPPVSLYEARSRIQYIPAVNVGGTPFGDAPIDTQDPILKDQFRNTQKAGEFGRPTGTTQGVVRQHLPQILEPEETPGSQTMSPMPEPTNIDLYAAGSEQSPEFPENRFLHKVEAGESIYAIARKYGVTTDSIVEANGLASPDRVFVGQEITLPNGSQRLTTGDSGVAPLPRRQQVGATVQKEVASETPLVSSSVAMQSSPVVPSPAKRLATIETASVSGNVNDVTPSPDKATAPEAKPVTRNVALTAVPKEKAEKIVTRDGFRWPARGRLIADFKQSRTGLNIEVPAGSAVRAVEEGEVIYVGDAVEGFGNLILIKHDNGYVSAYAHLQEIGIDKGARVNRGDQVGTVGMTGSVTRPQLHFELRKGATPVDPIPLFSS